jgi:hypothetical protein
VFRRFLFWSIITHSGAMRLLKLNDTLGFSLTRFAANNIPNYAILSHTWEADEHEVTLHDIMNGANGNKKGYKKMHFCAKQARKDGLDYFWVDSCCIDQSSSTEISTAINSMYRWYQNAAKCYVYLSDVSTDGSWESFRRSRWFTRGWTLQELLAPAFVEFYSQEGYPLGDKLSLVDEIKGITSIPIHVLQGRPLSEISINERISWISNRDTTVEEDIAYSLFGIFDIHMPLIYGEGAIKALRRLGEEIEKSLSFDEDSKLAQYYI